ncbi:MAG: molybdate ABC transporter substrate-binding protein [Bacteroidota bacterium]
MFFKNSLAIAAIIGMFPLAVQAETIKVAVAANFTATLTSIAADYAAATGNTVTITSGATGDFEAAIITNNGASGGYDLFLAANSAAPADLYNNHQSLVYSAGSPAVYATPFTYAKGALELWSNGAVDVSAGLPASGDFAYANPTTAPYGYAASQVLSGTYGITLPNARGYQYADIGATYTAIKNGVKPMGFVAKSQICVNGSYPTGTHHSYTSGYTPIVQNGIKLARSGRTTDETDVLNDFVSYMTTDSTALARISSACYDLP